MPASRPTPSTTRTAAWRACSMRWAASLTVADSRRHTGSAGERMLTGSLNTAGLMGWSSRASLRYSSSASCSCMLHLPPARRATSDLLAGELLRVPHVRPRPRLDVAEDLADVIPVVVDPFLEEVLDAEPAYLGVLAAPRQVAGLEPPDEGHAFRTHALELG